MGRHNIGGSVSNRGFLGATILLGETAMNHKSFITASIALLAIAGVGTIGLPSMPFAQAETTTAQSVAVAEQTVTFAIEKMTCAACPITVRAAMQGVEGVVSVSVDFDAKTATAIFDAVKTDAAEIGAASANAGYPATPIS